MPYWEDLAQLVKALMARRIDVGGSGGGLGQIWRGSGLNPFP